MSLVTSSNGSASNIEVNSTPDTLNLKSVSTTPSAVPFKSLAGITIISPFTYPVPSVVQVTVKICSSEFVVTVNKAPVPRVVGTPFLINVPLPGILVILIGPGFEVCG